MKYLQNPLWAEMPTNENLSQYPTILDILEDIAEQEEHNCSTIDPICRNVITQMLRRGHFLVSKEKDSPNVNLLPTGREIEVLYRGQSKFYEYCSPSLYRNWTEEKQLLTHLQMSEFKLLLDSHPILNEITNTPLHHPMINTPIRLGINYEGLAQHYGIHTSLLDFSNDKWVSAFFAVTSYDEKTDQYSVINPSHSLTNCYGVFYIYRNDYNSSSRQNAYPIGLHYFNRPGAQSGFALPMKNNQNLNELPNCQKIFFRHDSKANECVYRMNQHSRALFPEDDLIDLVQKIKDNNRHFSKDAIDACYNNYYKEMPRTDYDMLLTRNQIFSIEHPFVTFSKEKIMEEIAKWENGDRERYIQSLIVCSFYRI